MQGPARIRLHILGVARCAAQALLFAKLWEPGLGREVRGGPSQDSSPGRTPTRQRTPFEEGSFDLSPDWAPRKPWGLAPGREPRP